MKDVPDDAAPIDPLPGQTAERPVVGSIGVPTAAGESLEELVAQVYDQLRRMAQKFMSEERSDHTLQATALVHEAYVRLLGSRRVDIQTRAQFFHAAAEAMRRILIERGRERTRLKRGGANVGRNRIPLESIDLAAEMDGDEILELDEAISQLNEESPDVASVVRLRFFAGLGIEETGQILGMSPRTVNREWTYARAWLFRRLSNSRS